MQRIKQPWHPIRVPLGTITRPSRPSDNFAIQAAPPRIRTIKAVS